MLILVNYTQIVYTKKHKKERKGLDCWNGKIKHSFNVTQHFGYKFCRVGKENFAVSAI